MKIDAVCEGGSALLHLEGRLDREGAERLSGTLEDLLHDGVRSLRIDFSGVTYASSAASRVLARWQQELAILRGDVQLTSVPPALFDLLEDAGWDSDPGSGSLPGTAAVDLRRSSWHARAEFARSGRYELSACTPPSALLCRVQGDPERLTRAPFGPGDCSVVTLPDAGFGLGLGAIGGDYDECHERLGELIAVAGCVACFPGDGARKADYLVGGGRVVSRALLATGLVCEGGFAQLVRFSPKPEASAIPLSELAAVALDAVGGRVAGVVIAAESAGLCGAKLRRSPAGRNASPRFEVPAVREWLSFAPERIWSLTTVLVVGVVARAPAGPIAAHLRPLAAGGELCGHLHAAVFSYHPLPQRTVELSALVRGLFEHHELRDILHLVWDDRGDVAVDESALVRGVGWAAPVTRIF